MRWDIFCKVIDNHGDAGVCWRLSAELAARGEQVRLWIDDASPLAWMAPGGREGVTVLPWAAAEAAEASRSSESGKWAQPLTAAAGVADVVVEAFGCDPPDAFLARMARARPVWLNLEYLSAEGYVERNHALASLVSTGPAAGLPKHFFYPGFSDRTGGLLREHGLPARQAAFDRHTWLAGHGIDPAGSMVASLFCYEPPALPGLLARLAGAERPTWLLVAAGRPQAAVQQALAGLDAAQPGWNGGGRLRLHPLPLLTQPEFDHLLWACDLNFVRGEDSLVRALWAGRPLLWQLYPQEDDAHHAKLQAFLDWLRPPPEQARLHAIWNGAADGPLPPLAVDEWQPAALAGRERALALPELAASLLRFAGERARI